MCLYKTMLHLRRAIVFVAGSLFQAPVCDYPSVFRNSSDCCFEILAILSLFRYFVKLAVLGCAIFQKTYLQRLYMKHAFKDDAKTMLAKHTQQEHQGEPTLQPDLCCVSVSSS